MQEAAGKSAENFNKRGGQNKEGSSSFFILKNVPIGFFRTWEYIPTFLFDMCLQTNKTKKTLFVMANEINTLDLK